MNFDQVNHVPDIISLIMIWLGLSHFRCSYLPLHISEVRDYFLQYIKPDLKQSEIWFETENGDTIKWHLPVGVSYDMYQGVNRSNGVWHLTVHFSFFPEQVLLRCPSLDCVKAHFMSTIKEADSLKHASVCQWFLMKLLIVSQLLAYNSRLWLGC